MEITTKPFGAVTVADDSILSIPEGLIGFAESTRFALLSVPEERPFSWLQSATDPHLAMVVVNLREVLGAKFAPKVSGSDLAALGVKDTASLIFFGIVVVPDNPQLMTVNLKGPVAFSEQEKRGRQIILLNEEYHVRHLLLQEMEAAQAGEGR